MFLATFNIDRYVKMYEIIFSKLPLIFYSIALFNSLLVIKQVGGEQTKYFIPSPYLIQNSNLQPACPEIRLKKDLCKQISNSCNISRRTFSYVVPLLSDEFYLCKKRAGSPCLPNYMLSR